MPLSWAKAFRPTIALLYWTGKEVAAATSFEARVSIVGVDAGVERQHVAAGLDRHDDLFERGVAGALADAVDGALDLPRAAFDAGERVGDRQAEVVVAVDARRSPCRRSARARAASRNMRAILVRRRVADRVGQVDRRGAGLDRRLDAAAEDSRCSVRVASIGRPLDVLDEVAGLRHRRGDDLQHLVLGSLRIWCARWIGEVETKVWMRGRFAWRTASPARSMSADDGAGEAGDGRVLRRAWRSRLTASKSPFEAIGKPASMMSTPISSRSSATSSFSSSVMVAPGHCSPSRRVVSKIRTRSLGGPGVG